MDPYYKWLGIPPDEQPPHYYRLLGIRIFESDTEVIESAANQRMEYLQSLSGGDHPDAAQQLLSEMAHARITLLDQRQRKAYNAELKATTKPVPLVAPIKKTSRQNIRPTSAMNSSMDYQGDKSNGITLLSRTSKNGNRPRLRAAIIVTLVVCVLAAIFMFSTSVEEVTIKQDLQGKVEPHSDPNLRKEHISQSQGIGRNNTSHESEPHLSQKGSSSKKVAAESFGELVHPDSDTKDDFIIGSQRNSEEEWRVVKSINGTLVKDKTQSNVVRIELTGFENKKKVFIAGTFNNWHTAHNPMQRDGDLWFIEIPLPEIPFEFKYYIPPDPPVEKWHPDAVGQHYRVKGYSGDAAPTEDLLQDYSDATAFGLPDSAQIEITFERFKDARYQVFLIGEYNDFKGKDDQMTRANTGDWKIIKTLPVDKREIKFFIEQGGEWYPSENYKIDLSTTSGSSESSTTKSLPANQKAFSRADAKAILENNQIYVTNGVWYVLSTDGIINNDFVSRQYGKRLKVPAVVKALELLGARKPNQTEMRNPPPPLRR